MKTNQLKQCNNTKKWIKINIFSCIVNQLKMDNQFLSTPLLRDKKKINSARDMLQKDELIKGLELKNNKLRTEIMKIQNVIDQSLRDQPEDKNKQRQSIMRSEQNFQTMAKQLSNAYKKIKMYEYEINKFEDSQAQIGVVQKVKQVEGIIKQKKMMADRLRSKLQQQQKMINQNVKKLNNNNIQQEFERKIKSLSDQVKFLRQRQKEQQSKDQIRQANMKKQYQFIKRMENQLLEIGMSPGEIDQLKVRAVKKTQFTTIAESNVTKNNPNSREQSIIIDEPIEQRTVDNYKQIKSQIKLLQKMQADYEKKMIESDLQKQKAIKQNSDSRDRLVEIEDEIQRLERQILVQKGKVIPSNLRPLKPLRSISSHYMSNQKQKKNLVKVNLSVNKGSKTLAHMLKFDQVGMTSDKGQRFTDRNILGKKNLHSKVVSLTVFINNQTGAIGGIQAFYNHKKGGEYVKKDREIRQQQYKEQKITCGQGQWLKSVTGTLNEQDRLQSLNVITNRGQSKRFGEAKTTKKSFSFDIAPDQIPVCIFGSLLVFKQVGKPEYSIVQHFGIEINTQSAGKGQASYDMIDV